LLEVRADTGNDARMLTNLAKLEHVRGRALRVAVSTAAPPGVRVVWGCGCIATGASLDDLVVHDLACLIHRAEASQTTLVIRRP
jgi:hypothetical protein